jgi:hypothetical protein
MKSSLSTFVRHILNEEVFGAQAFVYHGSKLPPEKFVSILLNNEFKPGSGAGSMYGDGLYTVYDLKDTATDSGGYGEYTYKLKVNFHEFIVFDPEIAKKIYKKDLTPSEQAQKIGLGQDLVKKLKELDKVEKSKFSSEHALNASKFLKGKCKGIIYTGSRDGRCALLYDPTVAVPVSSKKMGESWIAIDRSKLKTSLTKSASGDWDKNDPSHNLKKMFMLPKDERIYPKDLDLSDTNFTKLPDGLKVKGNLYLKGSKITTLPPDLEVDGILNIEETKFTSLPSGLVVGDLRARDSALESLPDNLKVSGDLDIAKTKISFLPDGLSVRVLNVGNTKLESLPKDLKVSGALTIARTRISSLPSGLVLYLLNASESRLERLPDDLKVSGILFISRTKIKSLPANLNLSELQAIDTDLESLPSDLKVTKEINIMGTKIKTLPDDIEITGRFYPKTYQTQYDEIVERRNKKQTSESSLNSFVRQVLLEAKMDQVTARFQSKQFLNAIKHRDRDED